MPIHKDWRSKIHDVLRIKRVKLTGDYIQSNLDRFDLLLPRLVLGREVVLQRKDISALTNGEWSESSVGKFLKYLSRTGVVSVRSAGSRGLGITLHKDLTQSPWKRRRASETGKVTIKQPTKVEDRNPLKEEVEFEPMPTATPQPVSQFQVPQDDDYCTTLSLDMTLSALDKVAHGLLRVDTSFVKKLSGEQAVAAYKVQEALALAVRQLGQIRSAVGAGDNSDLEEIVGTS